MPSSSMKIWIAEATRVLEESHPCEARRIAEMGVKLLGEVLKRQEELERELATLKRQVLTNKVGKLVGETPPSGRLRPPKIWRDGQSSPSIEGVTEIQDRDSDLYRPTGDGKWSRVGSDGVTLDGSYSMDWIIEEYGPVVEVGKGVKKIRWFDDEINRNFTLPTSTAFVEDGEGDLWMTVTGDHSLWETSVRDHDEIKAEGHWTLYEIADRTGSVMMVRAEGKGPDFLRFEKGEEEPHETIKYVSSGKTSWFYQKNEEGLWYAPGVSAEMKEQHGKSAVTWEELLDHAEVLTEYRR